MATSWASLPLPMQRSNFELLAIGLPGPTGISPSQSSPIRSQDGPSYIHRISASFRNPLGSRSISVRSVHRDFQSPKTHLSPAGAAGSAALLNLPESGSHVQARHRASRNLRRSGGVGGGRYRGWGWRGSEIGGSCVGVLSGPAQSIGVARPIATRKGWCLRVLPGPLGCG